MIQLINFLYFLYCNQKDVEILSLNIYLEITENITIRGIDMCFSHYSNSANSALQNHLDTNKRMVKAKVNDFNIVLGELEVCEVKESCVMHLTTVDFLFAFLVIVS